MNLENYDALVSSSLNEFHEETCSIYGCLESMDIQLKKWVNDLIDRSSFFIENNDYNRSLSKAMIKLSLNVLYKYNKDKLGDLGYNLGGDVNTLRVISASKNSDYGIFNIMQTAQLGLCIRMMDKISRVYNLLGSGTMMVQEAVDDTIKDLLNYVFYFDLILRDAWMSKTELVQYNSLLTSENGIGLLQRFHERNC